MFVMLALALALVLLPPDPPRTFDLEKVDWSVTITANSRKIEGSVVHTLTPLKASNSIWFHSGKLGMDSITVDGAPATFTQAGEILTIKLPKIYSPGQHVKVKIDYHGQPTAGVYFIPASQAAPSKSAMVYTQGEMIDNRYWLPIYDLPNDKAAFESHITVPKGQYALSNGKLIEVLHGPKGDTYHWKLDEPQSTYLISFMAGEYADIPEQGGEIPTSYVVPKGLEDWGKATFDGTNKIVDFYGRQTGFKYPYPRFSQSAVCDFMFGGMENTTCVSQTINAMFPPSMSTTEDATGLIAHELAHQWFGDTLTCEGWPHAWLNEGFATFLPHFWFREKEGKDSYEYRKAHTIADGQGAQNGKKRSVVWTGYEEPIDTFDGVLYPGGASRLFLLMHELGEDTFWKGIQNYLEVNKFKNVITPDFFNAMGKVAHKDLTPFMKQWCYQEVLPTLTFTRTDGKLKIAQTGDPYDMNIEVGFLKNEKLVTRSIHVEDGTGELDLSEFGTAPFVVDPATISIANINTDAIKFSGEEWMSLYKASETGQRWRLLGKMQLSPAQKLDLFHWEPYNKLKEDWLGQIDSENDLVALASNSDRHLAWMALNRLAALPIAKNHLDLFRNTFNNDPNDDLRNSALNALLSNSPEAASFAETAWKTPSYHNSFAISALNYWVGHDTVKARKRALAAVEDEMPIFLRERAIDVLGQLKDEAGSREVYEALIHVAREPSFGARMAAIGALQNYGDPAAVSTLKLSANSSLHFMRRKAEAAIKALQGR